MLLPEQVPVLPGQTRFNTNQRAQPVAIYDFDLPDGRLMLTPQIWPIGPPAAHVTYSVAALRCCFTSAAPADA
jgi:hypothetical protein